MDKDKLALWLKEFNSKELYVVTWNNILKRLFCPFRVKVLVDVGPLKSGEIHWVEEVKVTLELKTVFIIDAQAYYYHNFDILVRGQ